jgi:uncharacterized membrane protein YphA (DoxX/SURF4 family)
MEQLLPNPQALFLMRLLSAAFFAILFLQSGLDKVLDRQGNLKWLSQHFSKSPLRGQVPVLLFLITLLELSAGVLCAVALATSLRAWGFWGAALSSVSLLSLFFGQRLAKDYAGAASLVGYFIASLLTMALWA